MNRLLQRTVILPALLLCALCMTGCAAQRPAGVAVLACEQYQQRILLLDPDMPWDNPQAIRWTWSANTDPGIPADQRKWFSNPDDAKPLDDGRTIITCASGGGCAVIDVPTGRATSFAFAGGNPHAVERLPGGLLVCISSTGATIKVFSPADGSAMDLRQTLQLRDGHGLYWDAARRRLWAVGRTELRNYTFNPLSPDQPLAPDAAYPLPADDGHDLSLSRDGTCLIITTDHNIWQFDLAARRFAPYAPLPEAHNPKTVSEGPPGRPTIVMLPKTQWWTDTVSSIDGNWQRTLPDARFYKARWAPMPPGSK